MSPFLNSFMPYFKQVIHIGVEHKQIFPILELEFGQSDGVPRVEDYRPAKRPRPLSQDTSSPMVVPSSASPLVIPKANKSPSSSQPMIPVQNNLPRVQLDMSNAMMAIQARGNECLVCGKRFDLFRSMLLPHYCGHFYKEIAQGHEEYFTEENCKLCGATATKRKSRIIHLGVKHELVLPYIQEVIKMRGEQNEDEDLEVQVKEEEEMEDKDQEVEEDLGDSSLVEVKEESEEEDLVVRMDDMKDDEQEEKDEVKATEEEKVVSRIIESVSQEISNTNGSEENDEEEVPEGTLTPLPSSPPCITVPSPRPRTPAALPVAPSIPNKSTPAEPSVAKLVVPSPSVQKSLAPKATETCPTPGGSVTSSPAPQPSIKTKIITRPEAEIARPAAAGREDELSEATLGLTCRICHATEASTHEMLTHYCNHFTEQLKQIAEKNVNEVCFANMCYMISLLYSRNTSVLNVERCWETISVGCFTLVFITPMFCPLCLRTFAHWDLRRRNEKRMDLRLRWTLL